MITRILTAIVALLLLVPLLIWGGVWGAGALSLLLTTLVIEVPFLANVFDLCNLTLREYGIALALAFSIIPMVEIVKLVHRIIDRRRGIEA